MKDIVAWAFLHLYGLLRISHITARCIASEQYSVKKSFILAHTYLFRKLDPPEECRVSNVRTSVESTLQKIRKMCGRSSAVLCTHYPPYSRSRNRLSIQQFPAE